MSLKTAKYKFKHIGVPTNEVQKNETFYEGLGIYGTDPENTEYFMEYIRPVEGSTFFPILLEKPHVSFEVENLEEAMKDEKVVVEPFSPLPGLMLAYIDVSGVIIELCAAC